MQTIKPEKIITTISNLKTGEVYKTEDEWKANDVSISYDYIFVDMQVNNNGGPSVVRELKRSEKVIDSTIVLDRKSVV